MMRRGDRSFVETVGDFSREWGIRAQCQEEFQNFGERGSGKLVGRPRQLARVHEQALPLKRKAAR